MVVINKIDLPRILDIGPAGRMSASRPVIETSAIRGDGINAAIEAIGKALANGNGAGDPTPLVATLRHREILERTLGAVRKAKQGARDGAGGELVAEDIRCALGALAEMTGQTSDQEVLDRIFSTFCVGK